MPFQKFPKLDFNAEVAKLNDLGEDWISDPKGISIYTLMRQALKKIKTSPEMRLAIFMKYSYGWLYSGEENRDWIQAAKEIVKILGGK